MDFSSRSRGCRVLGDYLCSSNARGLLYCVYLLLYSFREIVLNTFAVTLFPPFRRL